MADRQNNRGEPRKERVERDAPRNEGWAERNESGGANIAADVEDRAQLASTPRRDPHGLDREWFAGSWTDTGDCADAGAFNRDGRYRLADGTRGMWNVRGGRLVIENASGRTEVQLRRVADDAVQIVHEDGSAGRSTRC